MNEVANISSQRRGPKRLCPRHMLRHGDVTVQWGSHSGWQDIGVANPKQPKITQGSSWMAQGNLLWKINNSLGMMDCHFEGVCRRITWEPSKEMNTCYLSYALSYTLCIFFSSEIWRAISWNSLFCLFSDHIHILWDWLSFKSVK